MRDEKSINKFKWENIGDIVEGRPNLGLDVPVAVYRLMQYTMRDILVKEYGDDTARLLFYKAGKLAGKHFCQNNLNIDLTFSEFIAELKKVLKDQKIGILRVEKADLNNMNIVLTVSEDLDCSGLPFMDDEVCEYDEGFIAGILKAYSGEEFLVKEIDCWAKGDRVCRFEINPNSNSGK
jgi:predicted hydrocarbon binding protein